jgi:short-subunit dehydrogenase
VPRLDSWKDKVVLITGASSGIGRVLAMRVAKEGAQVVLVARREDRLRAIQGEVVAAGGTAEVVPCDVADREQVFACTQRVLERFGRVDVLVNNAGYGHHRAFIDWDLDDMERMLRVNFLGSLYFTKALIASMVERKSGWVVFTASVAGKIGVPEESAYVASKFAMVGFAEALTIEVEDANVHVLVVCPGAVETDFFDTEAKERLPEVAKKRMIPPDAVVDAMVHALARGKHDVTVPSGIKAAYVVRAVAPNFLRKNVKRRTIGALERRKD